MKLLRAQRIADHLESSRATVFRLVDEEGMPCHILRNKPGQRRMIRFDLAEVEEWLKGRRARQIHGTLTGERYTRRRTE